MAPGICPCLNSIPLRTSITGGALFLFTRVAKSLAFTVVRSAPNTCVDVTPNFSKSPALQPYSGCTDPSRFPSVQTVASRARLALHSALQGGPARFAAWWSVQLGSCSASFQFPVKSPLDSSTHQHLYTPRVRAPQVRSSSSRISSQRAAVGQFSFAYSALAAMRIGMSRSASFQSVRKS
jgi:hypothetical protein